MRITLPSGTEAELVTPSTDTEIGLVIIPDIFGLRPLFDDLAARLANEWSMTTCVVEPFPGLDLGEEIESRYAAVPNLDDEANLRDLLEGADATGCEKVVLLGFCMGGMYAYKAVRNDRFAKIASFYGIIRLPEIWAGPGQGEPLDMISTDNSDRLLAIIGGLDHFTPDGDVEALDATGATLVRYPEAEHGFAHDADRPAHRPDDAADAFARARKWLTV